MHRILLLLAGLTLVSALRAQTASLTASTLGYAPAGGQITLTHGVTYTGLSPAAYAFSMDLPEGWSFVSQTLPAGLTAAASPGAGSQTLEWAFSAFPANSFSFTFTLAYTAGLTGNQTLPVALAQYRSPTTNLTVSPLTFTLAIPPSITTQPVSQTATVGNTVTFTGAAAGAPTPTLRWHRNGSPLSDGGRISGATTASLQITGLLSADAGNYTLVASNASGPDATSTAATLTVNRATQTITFPALPTKTYGDAAFTISATSSAGLPVSFSSASPTIATVSGSTVTVLAAGNATISASQAGDADYLPASDVPRVLTVAKAPQTITFGALATQATGQVSVALSATASSGLPVSLASGNLTVATISGTTATLLAGGSSTITASQAGNGNYLAAASVDQVLRVLDAKASHAVVGNGYFAGGTVTVTSTLTYSGTPGSIGWEVLLPTGWSYASGGGSEGDVKPIAGTTGLLEWAWTTVPASPVTFTYQLNVPSTTTGNQELAALVVYREAGQVAQTVGKPDPLPVPQITSHTADTDNNMRIGLLELTRVIELYNTRNGSRTGAYKLDSAGEDGFAPEPTRASATVVSLSRYHSADTNRDGKLGLLELTRVIELYNYRPAGGGRTGQYRIQIGTEDGFAPGPGT